jgi:hypothetical protein
MCAQGIRIDRGASVLDYNNSEHLFENIDIDGCSEAGVTINQSQAKTLRFYDCNAGNTPKGVYCINGSFSWHGGSISPGEPLAWAASTSYTVGQRRSNSSKVYEVITAGTSASSGGPTTTASDITDGTVHWMYLSAGKEGLMFDIVATNDPITIEGVQSEGTGRILRTGAGVLAGSGHPTTLPTPTER